LFPCLIFRPGSVISITQILYPNVTTNTRAVKCAEFRDIKLGHFSKSLDVKDLQVKSLGNLSLFLSEADLEVRQTTA